MVTLDVPVDLDSMLGSLSSFNCSDRDGDSSQVAPSATPLGLNTIVVGATIFVFCDIPWLVWEGSLYQYLQQVRPGMSDCSRMERRNRTAHPLVPPYVLTGTAWLVAESTWRLSIAPEPGRRCYCEDDAHDNDRSAYLG